VHQPQTNMIKKNILLLLILSNCICFSSFAQFFDNVVYNRKAVYAELFANSLGASINYEYLYKDNGIKNGSRYGAGYFVNFLEKNSPTIISANAEHISFAGSRYHHVEWGIGASFQYKYYKKNYQTVEYYINNTDTLARYTDHQYKYQRIGPAIVPRIGYRYESPDGGLLVRVAYTPLIYILNTEKEFTDGTRTSRNFIPFATKFAWGGISVGLSFY
jgi:hypothetical protein